MADRPPSAAVDRSLLARLRAGDGAALAAVYDAHAPLVYRVAVRILGNDEDARDLVQDVFVEAWRNVERFDPARGGLESWLITMARSRGIDRLRAGATRKRRDEVLAREAPIATDATGTPLRRLMADDDSRRVRAAMARLPVEQRHALEVAYWEGLSHTAIATQLGVPLGTIKTRIRQGMLRLRDLLDDDRGAGPESQARVSR